MSKVYINANGSLGIGPTITPATLNANPYVPNLSIPEGGTITFGTYTFTVDQLGELLSKLLLQYPELSI